MEGPGISSAHSPPITITMCVSVYDIVGRVFSALSQKKVIAPGSFERFVHAVAALPSD